MRGESRIIAFFFSLKGTIWLLQITNIHLLFKYIFKQGYIYIELCSITASEFFTFYPYLLNFTFILGSAEPSSFS